MATLRENWEKDLARGFDVTIWKGMQAQRIERELLVKIVSEPAGEMFAICSARNQDGEQTYRFYISNETPNRTEIYVYEKNMSRENSGKEISIVADKAISDMERRCCYKQLRSYCNQIVTFLFDNRVWM